LTIKKFVTFSLAIHAVVFACIYFIQVRSSAEKKPTEYTANLVSPEELQPPPKVRQLPPSPKKLTHVLPVPKAPNKVLPPSSLPFRPKPVPTLESPVVPGEGKEAGKSLPKGLRPKEGEAGKSGGGKGESDVRDTRNAVEPGKPGFSGREKLFDKGTIESIARNDAGRPGSKAKKDDAITFNTDDYRFAGYMKLLRDKIESIWVYPPDEAAKGHYGDLKIRFTIKKDGRLGEVNIERTSGYPSLDKAAVKALKDGEPYWPLPDDWGMNEYTILGHFIYSLYGYHQIR